AHWLIMWGCILAAAITFPLVFGWIHFQTLPDSYEHYRVYVFGFPTVSFRVGSWFAFLIFHGLVWSSFLVIPGVMLAFRRRMRDHGAAAVQRFGEDILPLMLLFAISVTGLLIWISYTWMHGYAYSFLAIIHAITVILTLLWLPFGKFFHIFQRPAQLGVTFYKEIGHEAERAHCERCGVDFASKMHIDDLIAVEKQLGYCYETDSAAGRPSHYQRVCPKCRRSMLALSQGRLWASSLQGRQEQ
ncbi:MAG: MFS transporter, partial [Anaerolineae bacterium]|nr:MFS transporter [Anaerolineae bacterium]